MSITAHQVQNFSESDPNGQVVPVVDRRLYDFLLGSSGIVTGGAITLVGGSTLHITSGWGVIKGCLFSISEQDIPAALSSSGTQTGILYIDLDTTNNTIEFGSKVGDTTLIQEDINTNGSKYQLGLCTYTADMVSVSNVSVIVPTISKITDNISSIETSLSGKQATITGAASSVTGSNLTTDRALVSNSSGKIAVSSTTSTELGYVHGVSSNIQTQLNAKQAASVGTANRALISNGSGNIAVSGVTSTELGYLSGVTSAIQTQLNSLNNNKAAKTNTVAGVQIQNNPTKAQVGYMVGSLSGTTLTLTGP